MRRTIMSALRIVVLSLLATTVWMGSVAIAQTRSRPGGASAPTPNRSQPRKFVSKSYSFACSFPGKVEEFSKPFKYGFGKTGTLQTFYSLSSDGSFVAGVSILTAAPADFEGDDEDILYEFMEGMKDEIAITS